MTMEFTKATRQQRKLRMALIGPAGAGKTMTALNVAKTLSANGTIAVIDTEHSSASLYSDLVPFDVCPLSSYDPRLYIEAIQTAVNAGYDTIIIDSLSHAWSGAGGVLEQVNAREGSGGNSFMAWGKVGTPLQNHLINTVMSAPVHIICTMRVKSDYVVEQNAKGKQEPRRVGLTPVQRDGVEYEFDVVGVLDIDHRLIIEKSRFPALAGEIIQSPSEELGTHIRTLLEQGEPVPAEKTQPDEAPSQTKTDGKPYDAASKERLQQVGYIETAWEADPEIAEKQRAWLTKNYGTDSLPSPLIADDVVEEIASKHGWAPAKQETMA